MLNILQQLSESIANTGTSMHTGGFCNNALTGSGGDNSAWQGGLWSRWDCIFSYLIGFTTAGFAATSMASFLLLIFFSMGAGILVFFVGIFLIGALLLGAFRFINIYLMSVLSLSFMFCIGYLFVPLLLFRATYEYFGRWLSMVFGYIMTPIIMFGFMAMMMIALDITIFSGNFSVF